MIHSQAIGTHDYQYLNNSITRSSVLADWTITMTKKDYELIAQWLKDSVYIDGQDKTCLYAGAIDLLLMRLQKDNPKFSPIRFKQVLGESDASKRI